MLCKINSMANLRPQLVTNANLLDRWGRGASCRRQFATAAEESGGQSDCTTHRQRSATGRSLHTEPKSRQNWSSQVLTLRWVCLQLEILTVGPLGRSKKSAWKVSQSWAVYSLALLFCSASHGSWEALLFCSIHPNSGFSHRWHHLLWIRDMIAICLCAGKDAMGNRCQWGC